LKSDVLIIFFYKSSDNLSQKWLHGRVSPKKLSRKKVLLFKKTTKLLREKLLREKLSPTAKCRLWQIVAVLQHWTPVKIELRLQNFFVKLDSRC
jgi:hypothetical protein